MASARRWAVILGIACLAGSTAASSPALRQVDENDRPSALLRGWSALRAMDCARCHGRDYEGWSAPSLIAAVRDGSRERFDRFVLDGDIVRGMPGYRSQALVVDELESIYAYLLARAEGNVMAGRPW